MLFKTKFVLKVLFVLIVVTTKVTEGENSDTKIFGGRSASTYEYLKHVAKISYGGKTCGGAIITPRAILTAANCVTDDGSKPLSQLDIDNAKICTGTYLANCKSPTAQVSRVKNVFVHKQFVQLEFANDIAIFILRQALVEDGNTVERIQLSDRKMPPNTTCAIIGWGDVRCERKFYELPEEAQYSMLNIMPEPFCEDLAPAANLTRELCALDINGNSKTCRGDTGSPLICDGRAVGIMSWTTLNSIYPNYFTAVLYYREWINKILRQVDYKLRSAGERFRAEYLCILFLLHLL